jgi:hypothetical protein
VVAKARKGKNFATKEEKKLFILVYHVLQDPMTWNG